MTDCGAADLPPALGGPALAPAVPALDLRGPRDALGSSRRWAGPDQAAPGHAESRPAGPLILSNTPVAAQHEESQKNMC